MVESPHPFPPGPDRRDLQLEHPGREPPEAHLRFSLPETGSDCVASTGRKSAGDLAPWVSSCVEIEECALMDFVVRSGDGFREGRAKRARSSSPT